MNATELASIRAEIKIAVAPSKFARGIDKAEDTHNAPAAFEVLPLLDALGRTYTTDAHAVTYTLRNGKPLTHQPRVNKDGLAWLLEQNYTITSSVLFADVDNPDHGDWTPALRATFDEQLRTLPVLQTCGVYFTAHGYRLVQPLCESVPIPDIERVQGAWLEELRDAGLKVDMACKEWPRHYRMPNVVRDGKPYRSPMVDLSRMAPRSITPLPEEQAPEHNAAPPVGDTLNAGQRRPALMSLAGSMHRRGMDADEIHAALIVTNRKRCRPMLLDKDLVQIANNVCRYTAAEPVGSVHYFDRGDQAELADATLDAFDPCRDCLVYADGLVYHYSAATGIWTPIPQDELRRRIKGFAGSPRGQNGVLSVSRSAADGAIVLAQAEVSRPGFFDEAPLGVAFADCYVQIIGGKIVRLPHAAEHRCRAGHAFAYQADADREPLDIFLEDVFADVDEQERAERIALLQEFCGACLVRMAPSYQQCLVLVGPGGNGKSELLRIIRAAMPDGTVVSLPPQLWAERFQLVGLVGAGANFVDELPEAEIIGTGVFKSVVTGEPVHVERKHQDAWTSRFHAGHAFACNALPSTQDLTEGFFRRFVLCNFTRSFDGAPGRKLDAGQAVVDACRPGIVAWALEGAARLQHQGRYTVPASSVVAKAKWKVDCDSVASFVDARCRREGSTAASTIYSSYKSWANDNGLRAVSSKTFAQRMGGIKLWSKRVGSGVFYPVTTLPHDVDGPVGSVGCVGSVGSPLLQQSEGSSDGCNGAQATLPTHTTLAAPPDPEPEPWAEVRI